MDIEKDLFKFNDHELPENFVSIAVRVDNGEPHHAAILIRHEKRNYLHHFPGGNEPPVVQDDFDEDGWYVYKLILSINPHDPDEVGAFLQYCRRVCKNSEITYSFIADGSGYDFTGQFVSNTGLPELGTCVGFCLNTLNNALIDVDTSILQLSDWDDSEIIDQWDQWSMAQVNAKYPSLDWNLYNAFKKRITPLEYLCIAFLETYPIRKEEVDAIKEVVLKEIVARFQ